MWAFISERVSAYYQPGIGLDVGYTMVSKNRCDACFLGASDLMSEIDINQIITQMSI